MGRGRPRKIDKYIISYLQDHKGTAVPYMELHNALNKKYGTSHEGLTNNIERLSQFRTIFKTWDGYILTDGGEHEILKELAGTLLWLKHAYSEHSDYYDVMITALSKLMLKEELPKRFYLEE